MTQKKIEPKQADDTYEQIESANFVKFNDIGDNISGKLIDKGKSDRYGFGMYTVVNETNDTVRFHGTKQLDDLMFSVNEGDYIRVELIDTESTPSGTMKLFSVYRKKH